MIAVVVGCCVFSGLSVYKFGRAAFGDPRKALGFVLALEGVHGRLARRDEQRRARRPRPHQRRRERIGDRALARGDSRRCEADARRAATRARTRAAGRAPKAEQSVAPGASVPAPASRTHAPRPTAVPSQALVTPVWRRATLDDVIDAEIVSEEKLLS